MFSGWSPGSGQACRECSAGMNGREGMESSMNPAGGDRRTFIHSQQGAGSKLDSYMISSLSASLSGKQRAQEKGCKISH